MDDFTDFVFCWVLITAMVGLPVLMILALRPKDPDDPIELTELDIVYGYEPDQWQKGFVEYKGGPLDGLVKEVMAANATLVWDGKEYKEQL